MKQQGEWAVTGQRLAELLLATREPFLCELQKWELSKLYLGSSRLIIEEFAGVCQDEGAANPWQLRQRYLQRRAALRAQQPFSASYLKDHGRVLRHFMRWYQKQIAAGELRLGKLSAEQLQGYWSTQEGALSYRQKILSRHIRCLMEFLQRSDVELSGELEPLLADYFEQRRLDRRGGGYGTMQNNRAKVVTRRHLIWLERQEHFPAGTAAAGASVAAAGIVAEEARAAAACAAARAAKHARCPVTGLGVAEATWVELDAPSTAATGEGPRPAQQGVCGPVTSGPRAHGMDAAWDQSGPDAFLRHAMARVDPGLPAGLLMKYLEHLVYEHGVVKGTVDRILRTTLALCRLLDEQGLVSFAPMRVVQLDEAVSSRVCAPEDDLLHRRQQVQKRHSELRGFLGYLYRRGLMGRDLAAALISPPCYQSSTPAVVLSEQQVHALLESVDRDWQRKTAEPLVGHFEVHELEAIFGAIDSTTPDGFRNLVMLRSLYNTGARSSELCGLRLQDLRLEQPAHVVLNGKGGKIRTVPLWPVTADLLRAYLKAARRTPKAGYEDFVFIGRRRNVLTRQGLYKIARLYIEAAACSLPLLRRSELHPVCSFRHTTATHLLMAGVPLPVIQEILGHARLETTTRYQALSLERKRQALQRMLDLRSQKSKISAEKPLPQWTDSQEVIDYLERL